MTIRKNTINPIIVGISKCNQNVDHFSRSYVSKKKGDLEDRKVTREMVRTYCEPMRLPLVETSSFTGFGVDSLFHAIILRIIQVKEVTKSGLTGHIRSN